jgi:hypothetical protein
MTKFWETLMSKVATLDIETVRHRRNLDIKVQNFDIVISLSRRFIDIDKCSFDICIQYYSFEIRYRISCSSISVLICLGCCSSCSVLDTDCCVHCTHFIVHQTFDDTPVWGVYWRGMYCPLRILSWPPSSAAAGATGPGAAGAAP